jgi:hypothetical protein
LSKAIGFIIAVLLSFGLGHEVATWNFVRGDIWELNSPMTVSAGGQEIGSLPKGTRLHYRSMAHDYVDFYLFIRAPIEESKEKTQKVKTDPERGIKLLKGSFE